MSDPIAELAEQVTPAAESRMVGGPIIEVTDSTHVKVDLGDKEISAYWPSGLGTAVVGVAVRVFVAAGVAEVLSAATPAPVTSSASVSRTSGWSVASGTPTVYLKGGLAHLEGIALRASGSSNTIGTIPAEYRPPRTVRMALPTENPSSTEGPVAHLEVTASGDLVAEVRTGGPSWTTDTWFILPATPWRTT